METDGIADDYFEGKGCKCFARSESECGCDADWTPQEVYRLRAENEELRAIVEQRLLAGATIHAMADELLKENNRLSDELKQADSEFSKLQDGNAKAEFDGTIMIFPKNYYRNQLEIKFMRVGERFFADPSKAEPNQFVWDEENKQFYFLNKNKDLFEIVFMPVKNNAC